MNQTDGGEGMSGYVVSDEFREKMRQIVMGENNPNYGHHWTEEMKQAARERFKDRDYNGSLNPNYGNRWNKEQRAKLSKIRKGNPLYVKDNHGRAKYWIILETGEVFHLKERVKARIKELPKIPTQYHFVEYSDDLKEESNRLKKLSEILSNRPYKIFIRDDKKLIYGLRNLKKELKGIGKKKFGEIKNNSIIHYKEHTYYLLNNSPFIQ